MLHNSSLVSIADLSRDKILYLMEMAQEFERHPNRKLMAALLPPCFLNLRHVQDFPLKLPLIDLEQVLSDLQIRK